jgi:hypothetical protein
MLSVNVLSSVQDKVFFSNTPKPFARSTKGFNANKVYRGEATLLESS